MKKLFTLFLLLFSVLSFSQISKTGGILYSNGDPNTKGLDTLTLKNLNKNSEVAVDHSTGSMYVFDRADSTYKAMAKVSELGNMVELTLPQFQSSVVYKTLEPGKVYKISGVHKNKPGFYIEKLYDDGNDLGITIYLTALTSNTFTNSGYGEFYNPKYQPVSTYDNTDKTGLWGIWDTSVTYVSNDRAIWGGYMWYSVAGGDGTATDDFTLSADWVKLPYSDTSAYNKVIDYIEYDFENDFITRRRDEIANIEVDYKLRNQDLDGWYYNHPISAMQWGNYNYTVDLDYLLIPGVKNNVVSNNSIFNIINFKGKACNANLIKDYTIVVNNLYNKNCELIGNSLNYTSVYNLNFISYSSFNTNRCFLTSIYDIVLNTGQINSNDLFDSYIYNVTLLSSYINNNILQSSRILNGSFDGGGVSRCSLNQDTRLNLNLSGTLTNYVQSAIMTNSIITEDISAATKIYGTYPKTIFKRADGTIRLSYYNNSDTLQVVNVND